MSYLLLTSQAAFWPRSMIARGRQCADSSPHASRIALDLNTHWEAQWFPDEFSVPGRAFGSRRSFPMCRLSGCSPLSSRAAEALFGARGVFQGLDRLHA